MAFTVTGRGTSEATYTTSGSIGDTFTPLENDIIIVACNKSTATALTSVSGWAATFSQIGIFSGSDHHIHVWAARIGASPSSDQVAITLPSDSYSCSVIQIAGAKTDGAVSTAFVQNQSVSVYNTTSPLAIPTLSAFASPTNLALTISGDKNNLTHTPQAGWTEAEQANLPTTNFHIATHYKASEDTTHTVEGASFGYKFISGVGFEIQEGASGPSVDDVDSDEVIENAQTGVSMTVANFTGNITGIKVKSGTAESTVSFSGSGSSYTFTAPDITAINTTPTAGTPFTTASHAVTVEATDGTDTAAIGIDFNPSTGYSVVEVASAVKTEGSVFENFTGTIPDTSQVLYPTSNNTSVSSTGIFTTDSTSDINMWYWDATAEEWTRFTAQVSESSGVTQMDMMMGYTPVRGGMLWV